MLANFDFSGATENYGAARLGPTVRSYCNADFGRVRGFCDRLFEKVPTDRVSTWHATCSCHRVAVRHYRELIAWQLADRFSAEVQRLIHESRLTQPDQGYRDQLLGAAEGVSANVAEGFLRFSRAEFARFLSYALGSLGEAETRLRHGVRRRYFTDADTAVAQQLARRALTAIVRLKQSLARQSETQLGTPVVRRRHGI